MPTTRVPIKDAAEILSVSVDTIRRRLRRGDLTGEYVDGKWLVDVEDPVESSGLSAMSAFAMRLINEEVEHLRAENERLVGIIEKMVGDESEQLAHDGERKRGLFSLRSSRP